MAPIGTIPRMQCKLHRGQTPLLVCRRPPQSRSSEVSIFEAAMFAGLWYLADSAEIAQFLVVGMADNCASDRHSIGAGEVLRKHRRDLGAEPRQRARRVDRPGPGRLGLRCRVISDRHDRRELRCFPRGHRNPRLPDGGRVVGARLATCQRYLRNLRHHETGFHPRGRALLPRSHPDQ